MKRIVSVFLSLLMLLCCVIPASATGLDPNTNGYSFDALPYLESNFFDTSYLSIGSSKDIYISLPSVTDVLYVSGVFETTDTNPVLKSSYFGNFTVTPLGNSLFSFYGSLGANYPITYTKGSNSSYILFLSLDITPVDYISHDIDLHYNLSFSYKYKHWPNGVGEDPVINSASYNETFTASSFPYSISTPLIHPNTGNISANYVTNEQNVHILSYLFFDWTKFDRVDLYFNNSFNSLTDYTFYVESINVLDSIQSGFIDGKMSTIVSLDFSDLDPNLLNHNCYIRFRGYDDVSSDTSYQLFYIYNITGFARTVSNNFWPSWLTRIINKLDNIFTGREQDQAGANSFNDSINEQADELEDLTADLNSVTRPPLSDVNLSTSGMVDQSVVVLATNGIGSILSNQIILRVLIMSLTFALAGFILFGKR